MAKTGTPTPRSAAQAFVDHLNAVLSATVSDARLPSRCSPCPVRSTRLRSPGSSVTFTGPDAERFLAELPEGLPPGEEARLRESVRVAEASMASAPANAVFAK